MIQFSALHLDIETKVKGLVFPSHLANHRGTDWSHGLGLGSGFEFQCAHTSQAFGGGGTRTGGGHSNRTRRLSRTWEEGDDIHGQRN